MGYLKRENALACFREGEDVFTIISFDSPAEGLYKKDPKTRMSSAWGIILFRRFSSGFSEDVNFALGNWKRPSSEPSANAFFGTDQNNPIQLNIDGSEVSIAYSFTNLSKTMTHYSIQIRRSTLRSIEDWTFPDDSLKKPDIRLTKSGHCAAFHR